MQLQIRESLWKEIITTGLLSIYLLHRKRNKRVLGCEKSPCGKDMLAPDKMKMRAFVKCIKEDGIDTFIRYIEANKKLGVIYHRTGVIGDYDLEIEDVVLQLLRRTK